MASVQGATDGQKGFQRGLGNPAQLERGHNAIATNDLVMRKRFAGDGCVVVQDNHQSLSGEAGQQLQDDQTSLKHNSFC